MKMNYPLKNKDGRRRSRFKTLTVVAVFVVTVLVINYTKPALFGSLVHSIGSPFFKIKVLSQNRFGGVLSYFRSKNIMANENSELKYKLNELEPALLQLDLIRKENEELKQDLGRYSLKEKILGYVVECPGFSPYDTLIIDVGKENGVKGGDKVVLGGDLVIGYIQEVFDSTSKVKLFSSSDEEMVAELPFSNLLVKIHGRGGGNFEIKIPKNVEVKKGAIVSLPGGDSSIVGIVESVGTEAADSMQLIIVRSPFNIYEIRKVYIIKSK